MGATSDLDAVQAPDEPSREPPSPGEEINEAAVEMGQWSWYLGFSPLAFLVTVIEEAIRRRRHRR